ncbi:MAG TPA: winged helix-turn-helix domain-containing protein [Ktedonobacterales bacterium]|nr:winged helix-turn-helix domain-containing protein [Ktedonobacterales bacterium]
MRKTADRQERQPRAGASGGARPVPPPHASAGNQPAPRIVVPDSVGHVDQRWMRQINRALVLACVREHGPLPRVLIARRTGLSRTAVSAITRDLLRDGLLREHGVLPASARGGRRARLLRALG